jgi:26S proteasome regulatory subunit N10
MQQNPENSVGVLCMASVGKVAGAKVLVSPTDDMGKILSSLHDAPVRGRVNFVESVQVAQLALKHRRNKNGSQRIILFVGSPLDADEASLVKAGKQLKKNNIAVDIILLGSDGDNAAKLRAFVDAVNSNDNSNLVQIPAGVVPSDALVSSRVIQSDAAADQGGGDGFPPAPREEFGGVDANLDPELAMALRPLPRPSDKR